MRRVRRCGQRWPAAKRVELGRVRLLDDLIALHLSEANAQTPGVMYAPLVGTKRSEVFILRVWGILRFYRHSAAGTIRH